MARTRAVPRRRPNINFQQRGNFERQRVAATRNISSSSENSSAASSTGRRSPLGNLARNLANDIGRLPASRPTSPLVRPRRRRGRRISESSSASNSSVAVERPPPRRRIRTHDVKIKFVLPRIKNIDVKHNGRVVRRMVVRRVAKHAAKKRNVRYGN